MSLAVPPKSQEVMPMGLFTGNPQKDVFKSAIFSPLLLV
jgi:hypothetical protein